MVDLDKALATQLANIEKRTGKSLDELAQIVQNSGLEKHMQLVKMLKTDLGMGHGDANTLVHIVRNADTSAASSDAESDDPLDGLYTGPKQALRPIHDQLLAAMQAFGAFETAPKKTYVSYRRKKQFVMIGPATKTRVDIGINMKDVLATDRLVAEPAGRMCNYKVKVTDVSQVDQELLDWIKIAYDAAG